MTTLLDTPHYVLAREPGQRSMLRLTRTAHPFQSVAEIEATSAALERALATIERSRYQLLVDLREGPMRNDPEFERAFERHRKALLKGYVRVAVLVRTAAGRLQVARHAREDGASIRVFDDERAALAFLAGGAGTR